MEVKIKEADGAVVCALEGEVDVNTSQQLRRGFDELVKRNEKKVLMDFSEVTYIDSSGLAALIEMFQNLKKTQSQLHFYGISGSIKNIFEITKLYKVFKIFDNYQNALESF